jgi:hypothetical protein
MPVAPAPNLTRSLSYSFVAWRQTVKRSPGLGGPMPVRVTMPPVGI